MSLEQEFFKNLSDREKELKIELMEAIGKHSSDHIDLISEDGELYIAYHSKHDSHKVNKKEFLAKDFDLERLEKLCDYLDISLIPND